MPKALGKAMAPASMNANSGLAGIFSSLQGSVAENRNQAPAVCQEIPDVVKRPSAVLGRTHGT